MILIYDSTRDPARGGGAMKKIKNVLALFGLVLLTSVFTVAHAAKSVACKDRYATGRYFLWSESYNIKQLDYERTKGAYEKQADYKKRAAKEQKEMRDAMDESATNFMQRGPINVKRDLAAGYEVEYDADREVLTIATHSIDKKDAKELKGSKAVYGFISEQGATEKKPYYFGVTKDRTDSFGVLYDPKGLKHKFLTVRSSKLKIKMAPNRAHALEGKLALVVSGSLVYPYKYVKYAAHDDLNMKTMSSFRDEYIVLDLECAAIINRMNNQVVHEF